MPAPKAGIFLSLPGHFNPGDEKAFYAIGISNTDLDMVFFVETSAGV
jgi:hypothetical protein